MRRRDPSTPLLSSLLDRQVPPIPWNDGDNIPWDAPGFSERMLASHLSQEHDLASRRGEVIDGHVEFLSQLLPEDGGRVLDLACGPGLYSHRLARRGHVCHGIDFGPASVRHAREVAEAEGLDCTFELADVRSADFGSGYDLVLVLFGQINVFRRSEARRIAEQSSGALAPGGILVLEPEDRESVAQRGPTADWSVEEQGGLFGDRPHLLLHEGFWDDEEATATDRWFVVDMETAEVEQHAMSTVGYTRDEIETLLGGAGLTDVTFSDRLGGVMDGNQGMYAVTARRPAPE